MPGAWSLHKFLAKLPLGRRRSRPPRKDRTCGVATRQRAIAAVTRMTLQPTSFRNGTLRRSAHLPAGLRGHWCLGWRSSAARGWRQPGRIVIDEAGSEQTPLAVADAILAASPRTAGWMGRLFVFYVASNAETITLESYGEASAAADSLVLRCLAMGRPFAASLVMLRHPGLMLQALWGSPWQLPQRLRKALAIAARRPGPALKYAEWVAVFDTWLEADLRRLEALAATLPSPPPRLHVLVFHGDTTPPGALAATMAALEGQAVSKVGTAVELAAALRQPADYLAVLQAGEVLPRHALGLAQVALLQAGCPAAACADEDALLSTGGRALPLLKPTPNHSLMLSGTLTRGLWLFRRDRIAEVSAPHWAECWRLAQWLRQPARDTLRIPFVLSHRRWDTEAAPPSALGQVVREHLDRLTWDASLDDSSFPLRVRPHPWHRPKVSIIIPSACRNPDVLGCIGAVLKDTTWPDFEIVLVVMQPQPPDAIQSAMIEQLSADPRLSVLHHTGPFNFSVANNVAAATTTADYICLLNDDVAPISADWLEAMMGQLNDPQVGIVGARLLYPNGTLQHGGVVMGLAGLCEHVFRYQRSTLPGYAHRSVLAQQYSVVTAACMLVRREVFDSMGGLDPILASGFNDVDFCLRAGRAGWNVVWTPDATLSHFETLTYGQHYSKSPSGIIWFSDIAFGACGERTPSAGRRARCGSGIPSPWPTVGSG